MSSEAIVWNGQLKGHLHYLCRNRNLRALLWSGLLNMQGHLQRTSMPHERRGAARHGGPAYTSHCHGRPYSFRSVSGMSRQHREQHDYPSKRQRHSAELATASLPRAHTRDGQSRTSHCHGRPYSLRSVSGTSRGHREQHDCPSELPHPMALHGVNVVSQHPRGTPRSSRDSGRSERKTPLAMPPAVSPTTLTMNSSREPQPAPRRLLNR